MLPKPRADLKPNTLDFERLPLVKPTGFREYDARWLFPNDINLMGLNAIGLFLMLVAFGSTGGLVGAEIGIAGGTAVLAQRVLEAIFGDQAVREMAAKARARLLELADQLYAAERERYAVALAESAPPADQVARLAAAATALRAVVR